jgi:RNA polymerase sigma-70 factor (ECF subfamily)
MLRIATNLALNHLRARRRTASLESGDEAEEPPVAEPPQARGEDDVERWTEASRALELVGELPDSQRTVLSLARLDGLKLREIASRLDVPLGTVKSRLHAATQWLTERWEESE